VRPACYHRRRLIPSFFQGDDPMIRVCVFVVSACVAGVFCAAVPEARSEEKPKGDKMWVFIGTYTGAKSKGIYRFEFDTTTGKLTGPELAAETQSPSFLAIHPSRKFLYAVGEAGLPGAKGGAVSAFTLDGKTGELKPLNQQSSVGAGPCHIVIDKTGKNALVANYGGGSVAVLPVGSDGKLAEASAFIQHKGKGADPGRQSGPHGHSINVDAGNHFAVAADLGLDQLLVYKFDADKGSLTPNDPPFRATAPAAGPRHFAFHPNGKWAYVINEMNLTLDAMAWDANKGTLTTMQTVSTLPKGATGKDFSTAEVVVHPSGKFVYGSNRGHNTIVGFAIDEKTGGLTLIGHQGEGIKTPRNFNIDPTGKFMIVANQDGGSIVVFRIDERTGKLKPTGITGEVGSPVCVKFVPRAP
jgi:6-phosphogluconolactonase